MSTALAPVDVVRRLLSAYFLSTAITSERPRAPWKFFLPAPHASIALELYVDHSVRTKVAATTLGQYPNAFAGQSVAEVADALDRTFVKYMAAAGIADKCLRGQQLAGSLLDLCSETDIARLAALINADLHQSSPLVAYLRPARGYCPPHHVVEESFVWLPGDADLGPFVQRVGVEASEVRNGFWPPLARWPDRSWPLSPTDSWIGCFATNDHDAEAQMQRILGALSLALSLPGSRALRAPNEWGGVIRFGRDLAHSFTLERYSLPRLSNPQAVSQQMLAMMRSALVDLWSCQRLQVALEFAAAGWDRPGRLGYLHNAIALDALFGVKSNTVRSIKEGITASAAVIEDVERRAELLLLIRNELMHGEFAAIERCPQYLTYLEEFGIDPAIDQVAILRACVWDICQSHPPRSEV